MPSPETTTNRMTSQYARRDAAASAIPIPPIATPAGRSQIAPRRSDQSPNSGWTIDARERRREHQHGGERVGEVELVDEERQQRGQRAAGEVDRAVAGRERRHRPPVDPLSHGAQPYPAGVG